MMTIRTWRVASSQRWVQKLLAACCLLLAALLLVGCRPEPLPPPTETSPTTAVVQLGVVSGAEQFARLITAVYPPENGVLNVVIGGQTPLFADLAAGQLDAILVHHIPESDENWFNPVALDGLAIVVHPENPVTTLSGSEVQALFNGRVANWSALGGPDQPVTLLVTPPGSGARTILARRIMAEQRVSINAQVAADDAALLAAVADTPGALGLSFMGTAANAPVKMVAVDGTAATPNSTGTQQYALTTPLYFVAPAEPTGPLRDFLAWAQSPTGQTIIGQTYGRVR